MRRSHSRGFTFIEVIISIGIFSMLALVVYQAISTFLKGDGMNREKTTVAALADQYLELARNLPYSSVGTVSGNPHGTLPDEPNGYITTYNGGSYKVFYEVTYVDDSADGTIAAGTDSAPNDYKQVKLTIKNQTTGISSNFLTSIVPKGLEGLASGGALSIQVIDAVGNPVPGASINIASVGLSPSINLTRTSDSAGKWIEVGLPNGTNAYHVSVTKSGYSTDATYPITGGNPNPTKPDPTIANGQVTQVSFAIDLLSTLTFNTLDGICQPISGVSFGVRGAKLIGTPSVYKFNNTYTSDSSGQSVLGNLEWDTYTPALASPSSSTYMIYGSSPIQQINLLPNTSQLFTLILGVATPQSLLVIVKDASTGNPLENASVTLSSTSPSYSNTLYTGGSLWSQNNWTGGSGQATFSNTTKYFSDNGNIDTTSSPTGIRLIASGGRVVANSGWLISSTFDTGTTSTNYTTLTWQPASQTSGTTAKFQIASNNDNATWNFIGPDGTASTYYTVPGTTISSAHNGNRYVRYKLYLDTTNNLLNPVVTSVGINYVSGCFTPGQVMFSWLGVGANYSATISLSDYLTKTITPISVGTNSYNVLTVNLSQ